MDVYGEIEREKKRDWVRKIVVTVGRGGRGREGWGQSEEGRERKGGWRGEGGRERDSVLCLCTF